MPALELDEKIGVHSKKAMQLFVFIEWAMVMCWKFEHSDVREGRFFAVKIVKAPELA